MPKYPVVIIIANNITAVEKWDEKSHEHWQKFSNIYVTVQ